MTGTQPPATGVGPAHTGPRPIARPLASCPACGSDRLDPVVELRTEEVHFFCLDCSRCWHVELGYVHRVAPEACLGCKNRERCEQTYAADHPAG